MSQLALRVNLGGTIAIKDVAHAAVIQRVQVALQHIAQLTVSEWQTAIHQAKLWSGERQAYAETVQWRMLGPMKAEAFSDYRHAYAIENGRPAYDMKRMLDTSLKVRVSKKGKRYLIIPFRHNTPGYTGHSTDMPDHVYAQARHLEISRVKSMGTRLSGTGAFDINTKQPLRVAQATYLWGGRLGAGSMGPNPRKKVDRFAGMVRMEDKAGKATKSVYLTFRVMSEGSSGWIRQAQPGQHIVQGVLQKMQPIAAEEIKNAVIGAVNVG